MLEKHLVTVWNPAYADAMEETLDLLLTRARAARANKIDSEDVFVWWGKLKSTNRQAPMPHLGEVLAMDRELDSDDPREVHLLYHRLPLALRGRGGADHQGGRPEARGWGCARLL